MSEEQALLSFEEPDEYELLDPIGSNDERPSTAGRQEHSGCISYLQRTIFQKDSTDRPQHLDGNCLEGGGACSLLVKS